MDSSVDNSTCVVDRDGMIVWASPSFIELFSHRASPVGMMFNQLFSGLVDVCRHGEVLEDRDRLGRRRFFSVECQRMTGPGGERVSEIIVLRNVTLMRTLYDISRLTTQTKSPKDLLEKVLWIVKETYGYTGLAGYVARGQEIELLASKGWTEKLKSMISIGPIAPDAPSMAGRCAYHREQMVTTIEQYGLMTTVKDAIERIGAEFVVATPMIDHDGLVGVLTVLHGRALTPSELDTLQTICNHIAIALNVRVSEENLTSQADQARLFVELLAHEIAAYNRIIQAWQEQGAGEKLPEDVLWAIHGSDEALNTVRTISDANGALVRSIPVEESVKRAIEDSTILAKPYGRKLTVTIKALPQDVKVDPLFHYAMRNIIVNSARHSTGKSVDVDIKGTKDRMGTCKIEVSDNGPGIPDELKSGVFRREDGQTGIGLYIVKKIVSRYGGRVWIEDRVPGNPGRGARVVITLPQAQD
ncbi:ATP-binding protein [Methanocella arvoryzae]|uniref:Signal transduction histidine kinase n=1 Tax=Methanocella arvoryzae (strain DSM 22066 / NBRC 105507 / MRE50) TaxID=351160 RepID=Q0W2R3_METAR|nr:ATP-binding protein [Methanocella arvoryzae]CAJ37330.1 putative signal transduction histidine kinase [Methanocella arvoryzae MRE50]